MLEMIDSSQFLNKEKEDSLDETIRLAQAKLWSERKDGRYWNFAPHLGLHFNAQYVLFASWFGRDARKVGYQPEYLKKLIIDSQLEDGSWKQLPDLNILSGEFNASI